MGSSDVGDQRGEVEGCVAGEEQKLEITRKDLNEWSAIVGRNKKGRVRDYVGWEA